MAAAPSPQPLVVGEANQNISETITNINQKQSYAALLQQKNSAVGSSKLELCPVHMVHGEPTVEFTVEEVNAFTREEGLHQAVIIKFSYGKPDLQELRQLFPKQFVVKGNCNVGQLEYRHILVRLDLFDDYVQVLSRTTGYVKSKGEEYFFRTFPWTMGFNPREETSKAVVWISMPDLPANLFAKKALMSIASAVGKPLTVDKATQDRTRPSTARVKVLLDLLDKHPKKVRIQIVDVISGRSIEHFQEIVYDNLPKYCSCCKHQGHDERSCRWRIEQDKEEGIDRQGSDGLDRFEKLQGDARGHLNTKTDVQLQDSVEKQNEQVLQKEGGKQIINVDNDMVVNRDGTVQNPPSGTALTREGVEVGGEKGPSAIADRPGETVQKTDVNTSSVSPLGPKVTGQQDLQLLKAVNTVVQESDLLCSANNAAVAAVIDRADESVEITDEDDTTDNQGVNRVPKVKTTEKNLLSQFAQGVKNTKAGQWCVVHRAVAGNVEKAPHSHVVGPLVDNKVTIEGHVDFENEKMAGHVAKEAEKVGKIDDHAGQLSDVLIENNYSIVVGQLKEESNAQKGEFNTPIAGQKDGNKGLQHFNNKTVGHLCLLSADLAEKMTKKAEVKEDAKNTLMQITTKEKDGTHAAKEKVAKQAGQSQNGVQKAGGTRGKEQIAGLSSSCATFRAGNVQQTCTADCKTCNGHVKSVQRAEGPQVAKGTEIKEKNVEKFAGHVKSGNAQIDAGHVKSDRVEHTVDGHFLALTDENVQQHIPDVVLQLTAADRDENDRDKAFSIANRPTDHVQIERPSSDAPIQAGQAILGTGEGTVNELQNNLAGQITHSSNAPLLHLENDMSKMKGDWNLVTSKKSPTKKQVSPKQQNISDRQNACNIGSSSNTFDVLATGGEHDGDAIVLHDRGIQARKGVWTAVREADGVVQMVAADGDGEKDIDHLDHSTPATVHLTSVGSQFQSTIPFLQLNNAVPPSEENGQQKEDTGGNPKIVSPTGKQNATTSGHVTSVKEKTAARHASRQQIQRVPNRFSSDDRKLLDTILFSHPRCVEVEEDDEQKQRVTTVPVNSTEESLTCKDIWDDRRSEVVNVRRPPMRNAKQKQAAPTKSTKPKRSKNNS